MDTESNEVVETLRYDRIRLYASIDRSLHDSEELLMDALEVLTGGWTARDGDEEDRLYGAEAHEWIGERMPQLLAGVEWAQERYVEHGGNDRVVLSDAAWAIAEIGKRIERAAAKAAEYSPEREAEATAAEDARMEAYANRGRTT
ncbi:MAG: hypothetical protein KF723_03300 [Rhizobiaceae bacterium]|nr:hypothetical protein [Rhizobiaceae bacterium]